MQKFELKIEEKDLKNQKELTREFRFEANEEIRDEVFLSVMKDFLGVVLHGDIRELKKLNIEVTAPVTKPEKSFIPSKRKLKGEEYLVDRLPKAAEVVKYFETNKRNNYLHTIYDVQKRFLGQTISASGKQSNIYSRFYLILKQAQDLFLEKHGKYELETFNRRVRGKGRMVRRSYYRFVPKGSKITGKKEEIKIPTVEQITEYLEAIGDANPNFYHTFKDCQIYFIGRVLGAEKDPDKVFYHRFFSRFHSVHRNLAKKYNGVWQTKYGGFGNHTFSVYTLKVNDKDDGDISIDEILGEDFGDESIEEIMV